MYKMTLLAALLALAGCASTTDKAADVGPADMPVASVPTGAPDSPPVATHPVTEQVASATEIQQAAPVQQAAVEPTGWERLSQRVLAWGDPMRRSVEQYCPPQNTTSNH
jgi:hypothetical protein